MSIPLKINPLGINPSIYISSPLIGKGTQSDPITLSFNPVYFRVDNNTNQFNINTTNIALKQDLNNYLPLSGGIITGPTVFNTAKEIQIGIDSANNESEGGQLHLLGNNKSDGWIIDQFPGANKYGSLRFYSDQVFSKEGLPTISFTYNNPNQPVLHIGQPFEQIDSRIYVRGIEGTYFNNEENPILQLNWNTRAETISNGLFTIRIPSFEKENQIFKIQSDAAPASGMLILQNFANNDSAVVEGFSLIHVNNLSNTQTIDLVFDKANQPNFWVNSNVHFTKNCNLSENIYVTSSLINITSNVKSHGAIYTNSFFNTSLTTVDINDNSSLKGARIWSSKDKNEKDLFYAETWLGTGSKLYGQLVVPDKTYSQYRTLSIGYDENNVPFLNTNIYPAGNDLNIATCKWVNDREEIITVYNGKTGILNNDGTDTSYAYISYKKSGNSGILYGNIQLSREACTNLKNNCPDLRSGHRLTLSVPLYGYYSSDTTISTHFITTTSPVIYDVSANNYKMIDTSTRSFMVGLSLSGGLLLACPRLDTTSISADDLIFFDFIGLCHI